MAKLMGRFPMIVWAGAILLGYTAGKMIVEDERVGALFGGMLAETAWLFPWLVAGVVLVIGRQRARKEIRVVKKLGRV